MKSISAGNVLSCSTNLSRSLHCQKVQGDDGVCEVLVAETGCKACMMILMAGTCTTVLGQTGLRHPRSTSAHHTIVLTLERGEHACTHARCGGPRAVRIRQLGHKGFYLITVPENYWVPVYVMSQILGAVKLEF